MYATVTLYRMLLVGKIWTGLGNGLVTCSAIDILKFFAKYPNQYYS